MLDEKMGQALGGISDAHLESAMGVYERKLRGRKIRRRLTACAAAVAILVTALVFWPVNDEPEIIAVPGVMKVYAAEIELTSESEVIYQALIGGGINSENPVWIPYTSVAGFGIPLTFSVPESLWGDVEITFEVSAEYGYFRDNKMNGQNLGSSIVLDNREKVYWRGTSIIDIAEEVGENGKFYADIIIYADNHIVGYGIVAFAYVDWSCIAYDAATIGFPMVDGEFQHVTEEYVWDKIMEYKKEKSDEKVVLPMG